MDCPHCHSSSTTEREGSWLSALPVPGLRAAVQRATVLNRVQVPTDIMFLFWRLRYKLRLRDLSEMFLIRGIVFTHEAVRNWELAPLLAVRKRRAGNGTGTSTRVCQERTGSDGSAVLH